MTNWQANGMRSDGDRFALLDDVTQPDADPEREACWPLLVVDDDDDVHHATEFALHGLRVLGRPLEFVHAASAAEAIALLARRDDVALVLLDVVMESEDAGLQAVERIRGELDMAAVRIILHTGQPGYAPELEAVGRYDINDYKTKSELTRSKLVTAVTAAIRSYAQIRRLEANRQTLERIIDGTNRFDAECGLATFADGIIAQTAALLGEAPAGMVCIGAADGQRRRWRGGMRHPGSCRAPCRVGEPAAGGASRSGGAGGARSLPARGRHSAPRALSRPQLRRAAGKETRRLFRVDRSDAGNRPPPARHLLQQHRAVR